MADILVVEDDRAIRNGEKALLQGEGYSVRTARDGDEAVALWRERRPDLILLDLMMPRRNGFSVCEEIRQSDRATPIIFLTARGDESDQVRGFALGADDFVAKTASEATLLARVRRALQRAEERHAAARRVAAVGDAQVDFDALTVRGGGVNERLTKTEADLLWLLAGERGRLFSYGEIMEVLRGGCALDEGALRVHVSRLKRKLGRAGSLLVNERGVGYSLLP